MSATFAQAWASYERANARARLAYLLTPATKFKQKCCAAGCPGRTTHPSGRCTSHRPTTNRRNPTL